MRTRFLATDFSAGTTTTTAEGGDRPSEALDFVLLPVPDIPAPSYSANSVHSFDEIPAFDISLEIDKLPIDDALSIFLSDVLPHFVDGARSEEPGIDSVKAKQESTVKIYHGEKEMDKIGFEKMEVEEKDRTTSDKKGGYGHIFVEFEIPEMDVYILPSKNGISSQSECLHNFFEVPEAELAMDPLKSELTLQEPAEILQSLYSVDVISVEYSMEQKAGLLEDANSVDGKHHSCNIKFPVFEVDMGSLDVHERTNKIDGFLNLEYIEKQQVMQLTQPDEVIGYNKELLGSSDSDWIKHLFHHSVAIHFLEDTKKSSQLDTISLVELSHCQQSSSLHGNQEVYSTCSAGPFMFIEFMFLDLDAYNFSEVFSCSAKRIEADACEDMFGENLNFRSFNQLIVCHELTLMDDSFKSLPVPIFSDQGTTSSLYKLVEELLAQLDWQCSSVSDGLYLDWHLLDGDECASSYCSSRLWEVDTCSVVEVNMNPTDCGKLIFDFILSEGHSRKLDAENNKEILNLSYDDISLYRPEKAELSILKNFGDGERINNDILPKTGGQKAQVFGESMSSDLDYFLNPRNCVVERENIPVDKLVNRTQSLQQNRDIDSAPVQKECKTKLEVPLNTVPAMDTYGNEPVDAVSEESSMIRLQTMPVCLESKHSLPCKPFGHNTVIIVNTRNFNEEMIISRRSTYQRILDMEHEGAQVVERDIGLPVDVIVSSSVCLTWYDCRNIGKKASAPEEAFSCLALCVESIATSILTSLSFAFSCCILIFEGESNFLCSIMELSDELYAAAASLGIDIQLFCSYSKEMTEEIILCCINIAAKSTTGIYPKMSDSESLAESFLTAIPSINPLSAHAILSSDATLGKFLELSNKEKNCALQTFQVPDESVALLSIISRYGEREDSKSALTDCSSTLSVPDSENIQFRSASERKKPKYTHTPDNASEPRNDLFSMDSQKLLPDDAYQQDLPNLSISCNPWLPGSTERLKSQNFDLSFNDKLPSDGQDIDDDMVNFNFADIVKSVDKSSLHDFPLAKGLQISDERGKPWMPQFDTDCSPRWNSATTLKNNLSRQSTKASGEVIDLEDTPGFGEKFFAANSSSFSSILLDVEKDYTATNSRINKRPSSAINLPIYTNPTEIHSASGSRAPRVARKRISKEDSKPQFNIINRNNISMTREGILEEDLVEIPQSSYKQSFQEKGTQSFCGTRLSNAVHSSQPQGSPWTIEFLNRIREKSRLHKQSVSCDLYTPSFGSSGNTSKVMKRKSPSILEFYKYKGGNAPQRVVEEKRRKKFSQPPDSSKTRKASAPCPSSLTPVDKTARRKLSFSTNGNGGQSKLVWTDKDYNTTQRRW